MFGSVEYGTPCRCLRQGSEQALVKEVVRAVGLAAKGRPITAGGGQDDAIGFCHFPASKVAAIAGRYNDDRGYRGAAARQRAGQLVRGKRPVRAGEPHAAAPLAMGS